MTQSEHQTCIAGKHYATNQCSLVTESIVDSRRVIRLQLPQEGGRTAAELSLLLSIPVRSLERLLNANVALGFLEKMGDNYCNSQTAQSYLVGDSPDYMGDFVTLAGTHGFSKWTRFTHCVKNNAPLEDLEADYKQNEERMQHFTRAMHNNAKGTARFLSSLPIWEDCSRLVDVGGGSGVYCITLAERFPHLHATLIDFPPVCKVARKYVDSSASKGRITVLEGDALRDQIRESGDVVLVSQVLHGMSDCQCETLLRQCYDSTTPGGKIIVHEFLADDSKVGPLYSTLFALNMLMTTPEGDAYTRSTVAGWLEHVGYRDISFHQTHGPSTFVIGHKK
jgi:ubiquinone/menaquinone biosynthesis C-methylase UbiE